MLGLLDIATMAFLSTPSSPGSLFAALSLAWWRGAEKFVSAGFASAHWHELILPGGAPERALHLVWVWLVVTPKSGLLGSLLVGCVFVFFVFFLEGSPTAYTLLWDLGHQYPSKLLPLERLCVKHHGAPACAALGPPWMRCLPMGMHVQVPLWRSLLWLPFSCNLQPGPALLQRVRACGSQPALCHPCSLFF